MASLIPLRPKGKKFNLTTEEMDCLTYYVISGCTKETAFLKFARPDFVGSKAVTTIKSVVSQFYASKDAKDYIDAYRATIEEVINPKPVETKESNIEERKAKAKARLVEFAMTLADNIEDAEDPEAVLKIADKIGLLDQDEQVEEVPRRYLPVQCGECRYRSFVEENCVDECQLCKYRKYGEVNGIHYEPEKQLEIGTVIA